MTKKRRRHTPEQIIRKLEEGHRQLAAGKELDEVCRHLEIAESTWHRWLAQYGGMKASDAKRLKELEGENARLKNPMFGRFARSRSQNGPGRFTAGRHRVSRSRSRPKPVLIERQILAHENDSRREHRGPPARPRSDRKATTRRRGAHHSDPQRRCPSFDGTPDIAPVRPNETGWRLPGTALGPIPSGPDSLNVELWSARSVRVITDRRSCGRRMAATTLACS
jgi:putative transposase